MPKAVARCLADFLLRVNSLEMMAEEIRVKIARNPYFQVETVFERLDKFKKGFLVPDDLNEYMLESKLYPSELEQYLVFRDFDVERAGVITLEQFRAEVLPQENAAVAKEVLGRRYYEGGVRLPLDLEYLLGRYFEHKLKAIKELGRIRGEMTQHQVYVVEESFALLDQLKDGVLTEPGKLDGFLRSQGKVMRKQQLERVFRVLSFRKGPITYESIQEHIDPIGRGYYIGYSQRVREKKALQESYYQQRMELNESVRRNAEQRAVIGGDIDSLRRSNDRLNHLMMEQEMEFRRMGR